MPVAKDCVQGFTYLPHHRGPLDEYMGRQLTLMKNHTAA